MGMTTAKMNLTMHMVMTIICALLIFTSLQMH